MKTAIFGGSFNPVHNGHLHLAAAYCRALSLDRVCFVPAAFPPWKAGEEIAPAGDRLQMVKLAVQGEPAYLVSDCELRRSGVSYTVDTVEQFCRDFPSDELFLIIGSDQFLQFQKWKDYEKIASGLTVCTAPRVHGLSRAQLLAHGEKIGLKRTFVLDPVIYPVLEVSSTEIRSRLHSGRPIGGLVPECVQKYIYERGLYGAV